MGLDSELDIFDSISNNDHLMDNNSDWMADCPAMNRQ
jgi:hypothetical protein